MNKDKSSDENRTIYRMKAVAIISVVCAHAAGEFTINSSLVSQSQKMLSFIGVFGVPIFFMISGYLFTLYNNDLLLFLSKKVKTILLPWFFCETLVYLYVVLRKGGMSITSWLKFLIGINHSTYYLTVLFICYILFWKIKKNNYLTFLLLIVSLMSIMMMQNSEFIKYMNCFTITPYLNPFNWIAYFSAGILIHRFGIAVLIQIANKLKYLTGITLIYFFYKGFTTDMKFSYWSQGAWIIISVFILFLIANLSIISNSHLLWMEKIGKMSFAIYLLHELLVGIVIKITSIYPNPFFVFVRPILVIASLMLMLEILNKILHILPQQFKIVLSCIGIRGDL